MNTARHPEWLAAVAPLAASVALWPLAARAHVDSGQAGDLVMAAGLYFLWRALG